jgi:subfamily B ATP-binding cassette protein MsbA
MKLRTLNISAFIRYFAVFYRYSRARLLVLVVLNLLSGYSEAFGIAVFFPLLTDGNLESGRVGAALKTAFRLLHRPATIGGMLALLIVLFILKGAFQFFAGAYQYRLSSSITLGLRKRIVERLRDADYAHVARLSTGTLTNIVGNEVNRTTVAFVWYTKMFPSLLNIVIFATVALLIDWRLTLTCAAMSLLALFILLPASGLARRYSEMTTQENSRLTALLIQTVHAFKYLRTTSAFGPFDQRISRSADELAHAEYRNGVVSSLVVALAQPLMVMFFALVLVLRGVTHGVPIAPILVSLFYLYRILSEVFVAQTTWQVFANFTAATDAVEQAVQDLEGSRERRGAQAFHAMARSLACRDLTFAYEPGRPLITGANLTIPRFSTVALVGESGSGKTTLVDLLTGTLKPTGGEVLVDDRPLAAIDVEAFRARLGYVPQDVVVFDDTVGNNISLWRCAPGDADGNRLIARVAAQAQCSEFIAAAGGLDALVGERGTKLSGGQRQRLAIARELFKNPDILILDEATSALDSESELAIRRSIDELKGQMTLILIAHRLSTVRNCDRIYVLDRGSIIEEGTYDELLARPGSRFRAMCELQHLLPRQSAAGQ